LSRKDVRRRQNHTLILDTAFILFLKHGIEHVGFLDIAQEADIARKTVYNHFSSKEQIVEELFHPILTDARSVLDTVTGNGLHESDSLLEKAAYYRSRTGIASSGEVLFADIVRVCMILYRLHTHRFAQIMRASLLEEVGRLSLSPELLAMHRSFMTSFHELILHSYKHTTYRFSDPGVCSHIIINCVFPLIDALPDDMRTEEVIGACLSGLLGAEERREV
jgi:AcrR family transcriptional regulator